MPEATLPLIFSTAFIVALTGALMPGPLLAITISESARRGFWAGPRLMAGHAILELGLIAILVTGLRVFLEHELVEPVVGLVGGLLLVGMGAVSLNTMRHKIDIPTAGAVKETGRTPIVTGIVGSISNPYWLIWWVTIGTTYLLWSLSLGVAGVATFFTGHILADIAWYCTVAFIIATGRKWFNDRVYRGLMAFCGLALLAVGGYFFASAIIYFTS
jgi:threonine/homoserine/homoserine lactone efflux protein